jgi:hypothetical protein
MLRHAASSTKRTGLSRGPWRLHTNAGEEIVVNLASATEARDEKDAEPYSPEVICAQLPDLLTARDDRNRGALLEMHGEVARHDSPGTSRPESDAHRTLLPGLTDAFRRGTLRAYARPRLAYAHSSKVAAPPAHLPLSSPKVGPTTGHLVVRVQTPTGSSISGVTVEVDGQKQKTDAAGTADFGSVAAQSYNIRAHRPDYGPIPGGSGPFVIGEASLSQAVAAGTTTTADIRMVTVTAMQVEHTPAIAATPLRIYKGAAGDVHVDHVLKCIVTCPRRAGSGPGTQVPVRVDWSFTAGGGNAPKANGGKDKTDVHFAAPPGVSMSGSGTTKASTITNDAGETSIAFRASVTSGDHFTIHAKVLRDPTHSAAGVVAQADSPRFEVWKRLDYNNLYRMQTGANAGVDLAPKCTVAHIQPAFTPAFTEYTVGAPHIIAYREYITNLVPPTAGQLPLNGAIRVRSDGADVRPVTVTGLVVAADGSTTVGADVLVLNGTVPVIGAKQFQKVVQVAVPHSGRSVTIETAAGAPVGTIGPHHTHIMPNFLFDTLAAVRVKAQAWYDANDAQVGIDLAALATSIGAVGYFMVGAAYYHPKLDGRPGTGLTTYYAGFPTVLIHHQGQSLHPDADWDSVDGVNQDKISCLFLNIKVGSYGSIVARHEIGHSSDHVSYGPGDHCPRNDCLMYASSTEPDFCKHAAEHSVKRTRGWSP